MTRFAVPAVILCAAIAPAANADAPQDAFRARIEAALAPEDEAARVKALLPLFHREGLDDRAKALVTRTAKRLAGLRGRPVSFETLTPDVEMVHVVNGYEYRPNLAPLGQVVFPNSMGGQTKILYGRPAGSDGLAFPATVRRLENPDAPPDKQLQILAMGVDHPAVTFEGWCDISLSNDTVKRLRVHDQKIGNQTQILRGQQIRACEIVNTSGRGALSLRLYEDDREIFHRQIDLPATTITYQAR